MSDEHLPINTEAIATATPIKGKCCICETECETTSWSVHHNCWVYICSEGCNLCKNNFQIYEIIKAQITKVFKESIDPNKSYLPKQNHNDR